MPGEKKPKAARPPLLVGEEGKYEGMDKRGKWWNITLTKKNDDGTYAAQVHDGTNSVWPVVHHSYVRTVRPRTPPLVPDLLWDEANLKLVLQASHDAARVILQGKKGAGVFIIPQMMHEAFTQANKIIPEHERAYILFSNKDSSEAFKITMPTPQHAIYPVMRQLFDRCGVKHNLTPELPSLIGEWEKHINGKGLTYWHNTITKNNTWKEPGDEAIEQALAKQLNQALAQSAETGVPRDRGETEAEMQRLADKLAAKKLSEVPVGADGNCQFSSIAFFVKGDANKQREVRDEIVQYLKDKSDVYINFMDESMNFAEYCKNISGRGWGDQITLVAAANIYNVNIELITSNKDTSMDKTIRAHDEEGTITEPSQTIRLSYLAEPDAQHYNPVVPQGSASHKARREPSVPV
eukprot:TRINITY_DN7962_c0_g2_i1.p2 TRINITY_DN7962_c0_g2~~TRINITY_DN7962_c0_g2_i1.p2  ORF type:complete len:408 (+),score=157.04 TRINITY_DN7962_c0_g2_i1:64-1287(+)